MTFGTTFVQSTFLDVPNKISRNENVMLNGVGLDCLSVDGKWRRMICLTVRPLCRLYKTLRCCLEKSGWNLEQACAPWDGDNIPVHH